VQTIQQDAEKVRQWRKTVIWFVSFVWFFWLNETNQMNQINQINKTNQINQTDRAFSDRQAIKVLLC